MAKRNWSVDDKLPWRLRKYLPTANLIERSVKNDFILDTCAGFDMDTFDGE